jgi:hypothetical protein
MESDSIQASLKDRHRVGTGGLLFAEEEVESDDIDSA